mgnify:CR=1 FL=1
MIGSSSLSDFAISSSFLNSAMMASFTSLTAEVEKFYADMEAAGLSKYLPKRFTGRVKRLEMINAQLWSRTKQLAILENEIETKSHIETINGAFGKTIYDTAKGIGATPAFEQLN